MRNNKIPFNPWNPDHMQSHGRERIRMTAENTARAFESLLMADYETLKELSAPGKQPSLVWIMAKTLLYEGENGKFRDTNRMLDRVIGKATQRMEVVAPAQVEQRLVSFPEFVARARYEAPYELQEQMMRFGIFEDGISRMILGARGYGKTDYVVILGVAYRLYLDWFAAMESKGSIAPSMTFLLMTKSNDRNASILEEIEKAAAANGVPFEKESASALRVQGLKGKDHSVAALTIGSSAVRGRHPKKIVLDDPVTVDDVSEATRRRVERLYNELAKLTNDILIIGQPVHKFDLYETLRPRIKKMEVTHGSIPELDHDLEAQRLAGVSEESIQASYFLKVISEAGNPLENIQFLDTFPPGSSVGFIDPSFEGGDFTAMTVIKSHFDGIAVFGKCWKRAWFNCVDEFQEVIDRCGVQRICFETNSLGEQPVVLLRELLEGVGVVGRKSVGNKHARIMSAGPFAKMIYVARSSDQTYIDQIVKYEYGAKYDDAPDSLASGMEWIGLIRGRR